MFSQIIEFQIQIVSSLVLNVMAKDINTARHVLKIESLIKFKELPQELALVLQERQININLFVLVFFYLKLLLK
jgi:hypothetical protein